MGTATTSAGKPWEINNTATGAGDITNTLATSGKYVDRNIKVTTNVPAGTVGTTGTTTLTMTPGAGSVSATSTDVALTTTGGDGKYNITVKGSGSVSASATGKGSITKAGWIGTGDVNGGSASKSASSNEATSTYFIDKAEPVLTNLSSGATGNWNITGIKTQDSSTKYAIGCNIVAGAGLNLKINEGYTKAIDKNQECWMDITNPTTKYIPEVKYANTATAGTTYEDISASAPVLIENDYLYINEGYAPAQKISLAKLVPDGADIKVGTGEAYIKSGKTARDDDGKLVTGTAPGVTITTSIGSKEISNPVIKTGDSSKYVITAKAGATLNGATVGGFIESASGASQTSWTKEIAAGAVGRSATTPSGKTATSMNDGETIKIGAGWYANDLYYKAPSSTATKATVTANSYSITDSVLSYEPAAGIYQYNADTAVTVNSAGYISSSDGTKNKGRLSVVIAAGEVDTDSASSATATSLDFGKKIKVGMGYYEEDAYYKVPNQSDGTKATVTSGSASISSLSYTYDSTNKRYNVTGSATIGAPTVSTAGYISSSAGTRNTNTASVSTTVSETNMSGALVADSTKTSGYSVYRVTASAGYNSASKNSDITVYQGEWS